MSVQVTPLHDRVLVRRLEEKEVVKGGIIIPDSAKKNHKKAKSSPQERGSWKKALACLWMLRSGTASCSANTAAAKSRSTTRNS